MRNFNEWLGKMRPSINGYSYYVDYEKIYENVDSIKVELNILNSLIGSENIEDDFKKLLEKYPEILKCIPILLAIRYKEIFAQDSNGAILYDFKNANCSPEQYAYFLRETGLFGLMSNQKVSNLIDYVTGVETGLDSNARKNRGGHQMEDLVESFIKETGAEYYKEMYLTDIEKKWGVDLSAISAEGTSTKRWDFVIKTPDTIYVMETNFYTGGGSKLNETARSYKMIAEETAAIDGVEFVWITDGAGWSSARRNLEETFNTMKNLYNISDMEDDVLNRLFNKES